MNAARSFDPTLPADAAAIAAADLSSSTPAANADALHGWMAAFDASTCAGEINRWGIALANSIRRALDDNDLADVRALAGLQQYAFDQHHSAVEAETLAAEAKFTQLRDAQGGVA